MCVCVCACVCVCVCVCVSKSDCKKAVRYSTITDHHKMIIKDFQLHRSNKRHHLAIYDNVMTMLS